MAAVLRWASALRRRELAAKAEAALQLGRASGRHPYRYIRATRARRFLSRERLLLALSVHALSGSSRGHSGHTLGGATGAVSPGCSCLPLRTAPFGGSA